MLTPDDLAPTPTSIDQILQSQLEEAVGHYFYAGCDRITKTILAQCQWSIVTLDMPTLTIACPDAETYWNLVGNIKCISDYLSRVTRPSRIEVIPGDRKNFYFKVEVGS
jgi:hypothetical protein